MKIATTKRKTAKAVWTQNPKLQSKARTPAPSIIPQLHTGKQKQQNNLTQQQHQNTKRIPKKWCSWEARMLKPEAKLPESLLAFEVLSVACGEAGFGNKALSGFQENW